MVRRQYGHLGRTALQVAFNRNLCTQESFAAYLSSLGFQVDRSMVARWATGQDHVPADIVVHLAVHTAAPEIIFGVLAHPCGCEVVPVPEGVAGSRGVVCSVLSLGGQVGIIQQELAHALDPQGPGGEAMTEAERTALTQGLEQIQHQVAATKQLLKPRKRTSQSQTSQVTLFPGNVPA